ncbi:hypothetical protein Bca4012_032419 [Brassica carinata]
MREKQELLRGVNAVAANMFTLLIEWKQKLDAVENTEKRTAKERKLWPLLSSVLGILLLSSTYAGRRYKTQSLFLLLQVLGFACCLGVKHISNENVRVLVV